MGQPLTPSADPPPSPPGDSKDPEQGSAERRQDANARQATRRDRYCGEVKPLRCEDPASVGRLGDVHRALSGPLASTASG